MAEPHSILSLSDDAFGWYFSGLVDGEGYFSVRCSQLRWKRSKIRSWRAEFGLRFRADEYSGLEAISQRMNCGNLTIFQPKDTSRNRNPEATWSVSKGTELVDVLVSHFDRFPLQLKKSRDFAIWKPCAIIIRNASLRSRKGKDSKVGRTRMHDDEAAFLEESAAKLKRVREFNSGEVPIPSTMPEVGLPLFELR